MFKTVGGDDVFKLSNDIVNAMETGTLLPGIFRAEGTGIGTASAGD